MGPGLLEVVTGEVSGLGSLAELPVRTRPAGPGRAAHEVLALLPYRQIAERGFACTDDGTPLLAMEVTEQAVMTVAEVVRRIADVPIELTGKHFDVDDETYAGIVRRVIRDEIGTGEGANFVIQRSLVADIADYSLAHALCLFRRLLEREQGAYWTYLVHTGDRTLVGASPERHVSLRDGTAVMNPISGTYRYPASGPTLPDVMEFLADPKETDELYMVVDEELKMMARICTDGCRVTGPHLREMARVAHTEYFIEGRTTHDVRDILRETMFAPTVTGSPLESACRVISRHEPGAAGTTAEPSHSSATTTQVSAASTPRSSSAPPTSTAAAGCASAWAPRSYGTRTRSPRSRRPVPKPPGCSTRWRATAVRASPTIPTSARRWPGATTRSRGSGSPTAPVTKTRTRFSPDARPSSSTPRTPSRTCSTSNFGRWAWT